MLEIEPQAPLLVRYEPLVRISFAKPVAEMSLDEMLQTVRELRALRSIRSLDTRGAVYQHLVGLEQAVLDAAERYFPDSAVRTLKFGPEALFPEAQDFLIVFDRVQMHVETTPVRVLPADGDPP